MTETPTRTLVRWENCRRWHIAQDARGDWTWCMSGPFGVRVAKADDGEKNVCRNCLREWEKTQK